MGKVNAFMFLSVDGYFKGPDEDISWHLHGEEEGQFSADSLKSGNILLFGRRTYEMMASFWPTPMAFESFPEVAEGMNRAEKIVFSRTMKDPAWQNTRVFSDNLDEQMKNIKQSSEKDITLLGSGSILTQLVNAALLDELQVMIDPIAIGNGYSIFRDIKAHLNLKLTGSQQFKSGVVLLNYEVLK